jgi:acetyl-CoA carboxylase biotin carboxylase subunit
MFTKVLIANRGEIAVRVIRACREMGIVPVAVYSDADRSALHVRLADEAYPLGSSPPLESYLNIEKMIGVARKCGAEAIHPGYGFLAENPKFVRRCEESGIVFIGPPSGSMEKMGIKTTSRRAMKDIGIPIIPGTVEPVENEADLLHVAQNIGFPVLLKASAGGGGKGLRLVTNADELQSAFALARSEAQSYFADPSVYVEKYLESPHHIEIQVLADQGGHVVHLGERECSIQRRYQKVIEETPSPFLDPETRRQMGEMAVKAAAGIGYLNAGTVEFIVDGNRNFYFLEMNTRLQVEHPITEMVTGIDLVKCQIEIAAGLPLRFRQEDIQPRGAALECRIYAEDPDSDFLPAPGKILRLQAPSGGLGVRRDSGVYEGFTVPIEYDPLLSKLITWGETREEAINRMLRALAEYKVYGIKTTIPFFKKVLLHPKFRAGNYTTAFIADLEEEPDAEDSEARGAAIIASAIRMYYETRAVQPTGDRRRAESPWKVEGRIERFRNRL